MTPKRSVMLNTDSRFFFLDSRYISNHKFQGWLQPSKLFYPPLTSEQNKLECSSSSSFFGLVCIISYEQDSKALRQDRLQRHIAIDQPEKTLPETKRSSFFAATLWTKMKKLYSIGTRGQCYKTFYRGNLLPFHGNTIILCYKAILFW